MKIIRFYDQSTGFDELYEGYIISQLDCLIDKESNTGYNKVINVNNKFTNFDDEKVTNYGN